MRFIENSLADSSTLGDEVTTQGGLAGINVADHNDADVGLVLFHWDVARGVKLISKQVCRGFIGYFSKNLKVFPEALWSWQTNKVS